ncbi:MAG: hypothetical protein IT453_01840 [Planctomycetes bacterium]|nr:hypothetical protein [Planctomycetota bacterium]
MDVVNPLVASQLVGGALGRFIHSVQPAQAQPFHGGYLCVGPTFTRHLVRAASGPANTCGGSISEDFNSYIATGQDPALGPGVQVWLQGWSRDAAAPFGDSLTNGVTAVICP